MDESKQLSHDPSGKTFCCGEEKIVIEAKQRVNTTLYQHHGACRYVGVIGSAAGQYDAFISCENPAIDEAANSLRLLAKRSC